MAHRIIFVSALLLAGSMAASAQSSAPVGPSFDCGRATEALSRIICGDAGLRRRDLELTQAYYTLRFAQPERSEPLRQEAITFQREVRLACAIPVSGPAGPERLPTLTQCVTDRLLAQRGMWLAQLRQLGNRSALDEAERGIEQHLELQSALRTQGFLAATAVIDGTFGPATRAAIRSAQRRAGLSADGFLSYTTATALMGLNFAEQTRGSNGMDNIPRSNGATRPSTASNEALVEATDYSPGTCASLGLVAQMGVRVREQGWTLAQALELATAPVEPGMRRRFAATIRFAYSQSTQAQAHENAVFECFSRRL